MTVGVRTHEVMFVDPLVSDADRLLFLGPFEDSDGPLVEILPEWTTMAHLLHHAGIFPSVKEAKKNGWNKPIPPGFDVSVHKKKTFSLFTLTRFD